MDTGIRRQPTSRSTMSRPHFRNLAAATLALSCGAFFAPAHAVKATGGEFNTLYAGLGAKGYDVVAYFTDATAVQGSDAYVAEYGGVKWQFASAAHREMFVANPEKYAPQYGGFCSWGVANRKLFDIDPVNGWQLVDGKLYLNFNKDINTTFGKDTKGFIGKANKYWPSLNR
jgi:YHS domain-containing protein